jgi:hypothetical protein
MRQAFPSGRIIRSTGSDREHHPGKPRAAIIFDDHPQTARQRSLRRIETNHVGSGWAVFGRAKTGSPERDHQGGAQRDPKPDLIRASQPD